jgi:hypothetical protein
MSKIILSILLLALATLARAENISKLVTLHHISSDDVRSMGLAGVTVTAAPNNSAVLVGMDTAVSAAEAIIKQVDVAPKFQDVDLIAYMIIASPKEAAAKALPAELEPVSKQLHSIFPYRSYTLLESAFLRVSNGGTANTDGILPNRGEETMPSTYQISARNLRVTSEGTDASVHIQDFSLNLTVWSKTTVGEKAEAHAHQIGLRTNVDVKVGQKVVIGKSNINGSEEALIVVLAARLGD